MTVEVFGLDPSSGAGTSSQVPEVVPKEAKAAAPRLRRIAAEASNAASGLRNFVLRRFNSRVTTRAPAVAPALDETAVKDYYSGIP